MSNPNEEARKRYSSRSRSRSYEREPKKRNSSRSRSRSYDREPRKRYRSRSRSSLTSRHYAPESRDYRDEPRRYRSRERSVHRERSRDHYDDGYNRPRDERSGNRNGSPRREKSPERKRRDSRDERAAQSKLKSPLHQHALSVSVAVPAVKVLPVKTSEAEKIETIHTQRTELEATSLPINAAVRAAKFNLELALFEVEKWELQIQAIERIKND